MSSQEELNLAAKMAREKALRVAQDAAKIEKEAVEKQEALVRQKRYEAMQAQHEADVKKRESDLICREARAKVILETQAIIADRERRKVEIAKELPQLEAKLAAEKAAERAAKRAEEKAAKEQAELEERMSYPKDPIEKKRREAAVAAQEKQIKEFESYHQIAKRFATRDERDAERMRIARAYIERGLKGKAAVGAEISGEWERKQQEEIARQAKVVKDAAEKRDKILAAIENSPFLMRKALTGGVDPCPLCKAEGTMRVESAAGSGLGIYCCGACDTLFDTLRVQNKWWMYREKEEKRVGWGRKHRFED
jgi:hypothetical protein